jgi:hypothetical protein
LFESPNSLSPSIGLSELPTCSSSTRSSNSVVKA